MKPNYEFGQFLLTFRGPIYATKAFNAPVWKSVKNKYNNLTNVDEEVTRIT